MSLSNMSSSTCNGNEEKTLVRLEGMENRDKQAAGGEWGSRRRVMKVGC